MCQGGNKDRELTISLGVHSLSQREKKREKTPPPPTPPAREACALEAHAPALVNALHPRSWNGLWRAVVLLAVCGTTVAFPRIFFFSPHGNLVFFLPFFAQPLLSQSDESPKKKIDAPVSLPSPPARPARTRSFCFSSLSHHRRFSRSARTTRSATPRLSSVRPRPVPAPAAPSRGEQRTVTPNLSHTQENHAWGGKKSAFFFSFFFLFSPVAFSLPTFCWRCEKKKKKNTKVHSCVLLFLKVFRRRLNIHPLSPTQPTPENQKKTNTNKNRLRR